MKIQVKRSDLLHALAAADGIARPNQMPLLECVLITATEVCGHGTTDIITIAATDTAMTILATMDGDVPKPGSIAMNAKRLRDVIKGAPDEAISIAVLDNAFIEIKSGKALYKLAAIPGRDFPKIPEPGKGKTATIDSDTLKQLIDRTLFSTSDDKSRTALNGALLEVTGGVASLTSTDGHRLSRATCSCNGQDFTALVPKEALAKIARIAYGDVELIVEAGRIFVRTEGLTMSSPLITVDFPPIAQLLAVDSKTGIVVNRAALIASIERTKITTSDTRGMNVDGRAGVLVLSSSHPDVGEVSDEIEADAATDKIRSCVAPKYLLEPLSRFTDETVRIKVSSELDPIVIEGGAGTDYLALAMPMRRD